MTDFAAARRTMVENQLRTYDVTDQVLLAAFETVPREVFVAPSEAEFAYLDREVLAADGATRLLKPMVLARMIQALELNQGEKVLDVGGAGYGAAILAGIGVQPVSLETDGGPAKAALAKVGLSDIPVVTGNLFGGAHAQAPFDAIIVHGASDLDPAELFLQLKEDGALAIVMGRGRSGRATIFRKVGANFSRARAFDAYAPVLADFERKPEFTF